MKFFAKNNICILTEKMKFHQSILILINLNELKIKSKTDTEILIISWFQFRLNQTLMEVKNPN